MMMVGLHQLLKLVLLLSVVNLPYCWSLCDISAARRDAHLGTRRVLKPCNKLADNIAKNAAGKAGVLSPSVVEAYKVCSVELVQKCRTHYNLSDFLFLSE